jgi:pyridoxal phosphate enzyme (YggS family)
MIMIHSDGTLLAQRYAAVKASLPKGITLIAVSKTRSVEEIKALYDLGQRDFGENYVQELRSKQPLLPMDIRWHFIGHLQRSNVKHIIPFVHLIHGVDGEALLDEIQKRASAIERSVEVLLQARIAQEETKHGLPLADLSSIVVGWSSARWPLIHLAGLMGMATLTDDPIIVKREFDLLAALFRVLKPQAPETVRFTVLSMGMSGDLEQALEAGSTMVRIGTAIFGERS